MVSNVLAAAAILRQHFRRLGTTGMLGLLGAVGLVPLALYMPREDWPRYFLLSLVCLYAGRKFVQLLSARGALKQLSLEEHFLKYGSSGRRVQKCVKNGDHMWTRSGIVSGLKAISSLRLPGDMMADEKRQCINRGYRQAFRTILPRPAIVDVGVIAVVGITMVLVPTIEVNLGTVMFLAGFVALALAGTVELARLFVNRQLVEGLDRWFNALSDWTLRECADLLHFRSVAYSHQLLYFTQPWFADGSDDGADGDDGLYVVAGDGGVLPAGIGHDDD